MCLLTYKIFLKISKNSYTSQGSLDVNNESGEITPGTWWTRTENILCLPLSRIGSKSGGNPKAIRDEFVTYFTSEQGSIPWQDKYS